MPTFAFELDPSLVIDPPMLTEIVSSKSFLNGKWKELSRHKLFNEPEVKKWFIPVDCSYWSIDIVTIVDPLTVIPNHQHTEPVMRYVLDGSFELNGVEYSRDDWVIVPAHFSYSIQTRSGYRILSKYHDECEECQWGALSKMGTAKLPAA